jgi:hypothetical protein
VSAEAIGVNQDEVLIPALEAYDAGEPYLAGARQG